MMPRPASPCEVYQELFRKIMASNPDPQNDLLNAAYVSWLLPRPQCCFAGWPVEEGYRWRRRGWNSSKRCLRSAGARLPKNLS
jgi:hypothetical protein